MGKLKNYMAKTYGDDWVEWYPLVQPYEPRLKKAYGKNWMGELDKEYGEGWRYNITAVVSKIGRNE